MTKTLDQSALDQLFFEARTHNQWQNTEVTDEILIKAWEMARWAPTSMNCNPTRITFVKSPSEKEKLIECLSDGNKEKTKAAPVTAIIAMDMDFFKNLPVLFPSFPGAADMFAELPDLKEETAFRNSSLQGAYFILSCRALGLDCGPMSGFDKEKVDEAFFAGTAFKANFLCNIGYGDKAGLYSRAPRPAFDEVCKIV